MDMTSRTASRIPVVCQEGETVRLIATTTERSSAFYEYSIVHTSVTRPTEYAWVADDSAVAEIIPGPRSNAEAWLHGDSFCQRGGQDLPRGARRASRGAVHGSPDSSDVAPGSVAWLALRATDVSGIVIPEATSLSAMLQLAPLDPPTFHDAPAAITALRDTTVGLIGMRAGLARYSVYARIFGAHKLRDTVTLLVK